VLMLPTLNVSGVAFGTNGVVLRLARAPDDD